MMGRQALLAVICWIAVNGSSAKAVITANSVGLIDNVSAESAPPLYRNVPVGVYSYASANPYASYSFNVPQYVAPNFNQIVPLNHERILAQSTNNYLKDSYGQRFVEAPQGYAYKAAIPQQFVPLQKLPAHLSQPLVAAAPNAQYGQATHFFGAPFRLASLQQISPQNGNPFGAPQPLVYAQNVRNLASFAPKQNNGQPIAQQQSTSNNNVYANVHKYGQYNQFWNEPKAQIVQEEPKISASDHNENQDITQSLPLVHAPKQTTITTFNNGKKTVVNLITKPPVPHLLDLTLLEPLTFDNPLVPQVQHFLPKIHSVTYKTLPELNQKKVITIKRKTTKKTKKQKKPKIVEDEVEVSHTPSVSPVINTELSYEVNSPNYKETISEKKVSYNKETTTKPVVISYEKKTEMKPVTYSYGKHTQKEPVHYNYVHNSNEPAQLKQAYLDDNKEKTKHLIYHFSPDELSEEQNGQNEHSSPHLESVEIFEENPNDSDSEEVLPQQQQNLQHNEPQHKQQQHEHQPQQNQQAEHQPQQQHQNQKHIEPQEHHHQQHQPYEPQQQQQYEPRQYHQYEPHQHDHHHQQHERHHNQHQKYDPQQHQKYEPQQHQKYEQHQQKYEPQQHQNYEPKQHQKYEAQQHQQYEPQQQQNYEPHQNKKYEPQQQQKFEPIRQEQYEPQQHQQYGPQQHQQYKPQHHQPHQNHEPQQQNQHVPQQKIHDNAQHELAEEAYNEPGKNFREEPEPEHREVAYYQNSKENIEPEQREEVYYPSPKNAHVESSEESPEPLVHKSSPQQEEKQYEAIVPEYEEDITILPAHQPHANLHAHENSNRDSNKKHNSHPEPQSEQVHYDYPKSSYYSSPPAPKEKSNRMIIKDDPPQQKEEVYKPNEELLEVMLKKQEVSEEDFEQAYKDAAYGFPAYDTPVRNTDREKEIYNPANYGVARFHNDFDDGEKSPIRQYEAVGDLYPAQMRSNYKDTRDKTNDDYYTDYSASRPESLVERKKKKEEYYDNYNEHKPQKYYAKDDSDKQQSAKYTVAPAFSFPGAPYKKFAKYTTRLTPLDEYNYVKEAPRDNSAFGSGTYTSKTQFLEPHYQYGFEPIRVSRLLDRELSAMASDHSPETVKKMYKESFHIEKSSTSKGEKLIS